MKNIITYALVAITFIVIAIQLPTDGTGGTLHPPVDVSVSLPTPIPDLIRELPTTSLASPAEAVFDSEDGEINKLVPTLVPVPKVFNEVGKTLDMKEEFTALAVNVYFESTNQSFQDKLIQVESVISRRELMYPDLTFSQVVRYNRPSTETEQLLNGCHYSWYCDGSSTKSIGKDHKSQQAWLEAQTAVMYNLRHFNSGKMKHRFTHYLTTKVEKKTWWVKYMKSDSRRVYGSHAFFMHDKKKVEARWAALKAKKNNS